MIEQKHTPEPWRWEFNRTHKSIQLVGGKPQFDKTVMDFGRWGMGGACPRFNEKIAGNELNIMVRVADIPDWVVPFAGREHHADWCANVIHPDARRIVACVNACASLPTESLESLAASGGRLTAADLMDRQIERTEQQRNQLLAALEAIERYNTSLPHGLLEQASAAIAAVKGGVS